jgi:hypothetical protein
MKSSCPGAPYRRALGLSLCSVLLACSVEVPDPAVAALPAALTEAAAASGPVAGCDVGFGVDCGFSPADCPAGARVIKGTAGPDWLVGRAGRDCILGLGGDDILWGLGGDDVLAGGPGNDVLWGSSGRDVLVGEGGDDTLFGGDGDDQLEGGAGNDTVFGEDGADVLLGGACHDLLFGQIGRDRIFGEGGSDRVIASGLSREVDGGEGVDACVGRSCELASASARVCSRDADCPTGRRCVRNSGICVLPTEARFDDVSCDGHDDDCDGVTDEDYAQQTASCGVGACAAIGRLVCDNGRVELQCVAASPRPSDAVCDGVDEDCDGSVDEDYQPTCAASGVTSCVAGSLRTTSCDDGNACSNDTCAAGACAHSAGSCDDGNPCTADLCDLALGCTSTPTLAACDDGNACTAADRCAADGSCVGTSVSPDDGNPCTDDSCDEASGVRHVAALGRACEDGDACTVSDVCDSAATCVSGSARSCDDGSFCNGVEACDPAVGCLAGTAPVVDDGVGCTIDSCDEAGDRILHALEPAACDDGLFCNGAESCHATAGCLAGAAPVVDDGVACTVDSCDETADRIVHEADAQRCDDGVFCNGREVCDRVRGCGPGSAPAIDDGIACTVDRCDDTSDRVVHEASDAACSDNDICTGLERCDFQLGCRPGTPLPVVDDRNPCTLDSCDPVTGQPRHTPDPCDDGSACTYDSCDPTLGCRHANNSLYCDDGSGCTTDDACSNGTCFGGAARDCDDQNDCTAESCNVQQDRCGYSRVADGVVCNGGSGVCRQGGCVVSCTPSQHAPSVNRLADQHGVVGVAMRVSVSASDQDGDPLTYQLAGAPLPPGLTLDVNTGEITGVPAHAALAGTGMTHRHVIAVSDGCSRVTSNAFSIQISGVPLPRPTALFDFDNAKVTGNSVRSVYGNFTGTIAGDVVTGQPSRVGQRFSFGGAGSITVGNTASPLKTAGDMTVAVALDGAAFAAPQVYYACGIPGEINGFAYAFQYGVLGDGRLRALHEDDEADNLSTSIQALTGGARHAGFVRNAGLRRYRSFLNGREDSGGPVSYASNASAFTECTVRIGSNNGTANFTRGSMDELAIWHVVLDADQMATVAWLYRKGISIERWIGATVSCDGILAADPSSIAGTYVISAAEAPSSVFCAMNGE